METRYAEARPDAAAIFAAKLQGGSILNLLSENCASLEGISTLPAAAEKDSACHNVLSSTNKAGEARRAWTVMGGFEREQINQPF